MGMQNVGGMSNLTIKLIYQEIINFYWESPIEKRGINETFSS